MNHENKFYAKELKRLIVHIGIGEMSWFDTSTFFENYSLHYILADHKQIDTTDTG